MLFVGHPATKSRVCCAKARAGSVHASAVSPCGTAPSSSMPTSARAEKPCRGWRMWCDFARVRLSIDPRCLTPLLSIFACNRGDKGSRPCRTTDDETAYLRSPHVVQLIKVLQDAGANLSVADTCLEVCLTFRACEGAVGSASLCYVYVALVADAVFWLCPRLLLMRCFSM